MTGAFKTPVSCECLECGKKFDFRKKLSNHIKATHGMSSKEYTVKHIHAGREPRCVVCGAETNYVAFQFKTHCPAHASIAMSEAGKIGGTIKRTWSKGHTKDTHPILARFSSDYAGEGNHFYGKKHSFKTTSQISDAKRLSFVEVCNRVTGSHDVTILSNAEDYVDRQATALRIVCNVCATSDNVSLFNIERAWRCRTCYPIGSRAQIEIGTWIRDTLGLDVQFSVRDVIRPYEFDIWVPSHNLAIEYHGLYWHSGGHINLYDSDRHIKKRRLAAEKNIRLLQFYSDEWLTKPLVCQSIIRNAFGQNTLRLNARDCELVDVSTSDAQTFLESSHIAGYVRSSHKIGLRHPQYGLVGIATLRRPFHEKWGNVLELARMAFKSNTTVRGGASRLLKRCNQIVDELQMDGLLSYADLRFGEGGVYEKCGFERVATTKGNYWYTDGISRFDRFRFRAQDGMTEKEYAESKNVRPVYGAGNAVYLLKRA